VEVDRRRAASLNWPGRREQAESYSVIKSMNENIGAGIWFVIWFFGIVIASFLEVYGAWSLWVDILRK